MQARSLRRIELFTRWHPRAKLAIADCLVRYCTEQLSFSGTVGEHELIFTRHESLLTRFTLIP